MDFDISGTLERVGTLDALCSVYRVEVEKKILNRVLKIIKLFKLVLKGKFLMAKKKYKIEKSLKMES